MKRKLSVVLLVAMLMTNLVMFNVNAEVAPETDILIVNDLNDLDFLDKDYRIMFKMNCESIYEINPEFEGTMKMHDREGNLIVTFYVTNEFLNMFVTGSAPAPESVSTVSIDEHKSYIRTYPTTGRLIYFMAYVGNIPHIMCLVK